MKHWVIEYGEGKNPQEWLGLMEGEDLLVKRDEEGNPILNPIKDVAADAYSGVEIERIVGRKLRISSQDSAGNKSTQITAFLEEKITLYRWNGETIKIIQLVEDENDEENEVRFLPAHLVRPGSHSLEILRPSVYRSSVSMSRFGWHSVDRYSHVHDPPSGLFNIAWDNLLKLKDGDAIRLSR
jgi:hypothetical protein